MKNINNSLKELVFSPAVSGYEWELGITNTLQRLAGKKAMIIGDCLVYRFGSGRKKILVSAHMDEVGFFITDVRKDYARIMPIGDVEVEDIIGERLTFFCPNGPTTSNIIKKFSTFTQAKIYGLRSPKIGDVGTFQKKFTMDKDIVNSPSLDNKVGCLSLLLLMRELSSIPLKTKVYICFSSREEVGVNGIMSVAKKIQPDLCLDIDSAYAKPVANKENWQIPEIGKGPAIQLMGTSFIVRSSNRRILEEAATKYEIPWQFEIPTATSGGTNATSLVNAGYDVMQINIPVANQHSAKSKADTRDIVSTSQLLRAVLEILG